MLTAAIAAPKISFEKVDMIFVLCEWVNNDALLLTCRRVGLRGRTFHHPFT
jgi:hypothetical protein